MQRVIMMLMVMVMLIGCVESANLAQTGSSTPSNTTIDFVTPIMTLQSAPTSDSTQTAIAASLTGENNIPLPTSSIAKTAVPSEDAVKLISVLPNGETHLGVDAQVSADGRFVIYRGEGNQLYIRDMAVFAPVPIPAASGNTATTGWGVAPAISADGRTVAFFSNAPYFVEDPYQECPEHIANECGSLYIYNIAAATFERIPVASAWPTMADIALSADGRYVAFAVPDAFLHEGVFLYDRNSKTLTTIRAGDVNDPSLTAIVGGMAVDMSADGRYIVFASPDDGIVSGDTNHVSDVFLYDRDTEITELISKPLFWGAGSQPSGFQFVPNTGGASESGLAISANGRHVVFMSTNTGLVNIDLPACKHWPWSDTFPACRHIYLYDHETKEIELVSISDAGTPGNRASEGGGVSSDGRFVVFTSFADNLVSSIETECNYFPEEEGCPQIYLRDRLKEQTYLVSEGIIGYYPDGMSYGGSVTDDGNYIVFSSTASSITSDSPPLDGATNPNDTARLRLYIADLFALLEKRE